MKYVDEFRNSKVAKKLIELIKEKAKDIKTDVALMEVCGTHTVAMFRYGIRKILPLNIRVISGPGCPVCVTSQADIDKAIGFSNLEGTIITTFGDMMKVPGTKSSLQDLRAQGRDIRVVYSTLDALQIANDNKDKNVIHIAIGFETTVPTIAAAILRAKAQKMKNFYIMPAHKIIPPALKILAGSAKSKIGGFLLPGHVSTIIGPKPYQFLAKKHKTPCVIAGFEAIDILLSINMLLEQIINNDPKVQTQYFRCVHPKGNISAQKIINKVFQVGDVQWRGLGLMPKSGLFLRKAFKSFDAMEKFPVKTLKQKKTACKCGDVLQGIITPEKCPLFAKICNPRMPIGPCMVSSEGACSAYYRYGGKRSG
ncbi:MAG: hydrogenase formation protein HypD [Candidatus Omnitrophica bacterium]|nr:hydrogenase formation protein HypD [Candidatus Omnitrophota bacterium]